MPKEVGRTGGSLTISSGAVMGSGMLHEPKTEAAFVPEAA